MACLVEFVADPRTAVPLSSRTLGGCLLDPLNNGADLRADLLRRQVLSSERCNPRNGRYRRRDLPPVRSTEASVQLIPAFVFWFGPSGRPFLPPGT